MMMLIRLLAEEPGNSFVRSWAAHRKGVLIWEHILSHRDALQESLGEGGQLLFLSRLSRRVRRGDVSLALHAREQSIAESFLVDQVCAIRGVTSVQWYGLHGMTFYPLPRDTREYSRFVVEVGTDLPATRDVCTALGRLDVPDHLLKSYVCYKFDGLGHTIQFSLLGPNEEAVTAFLRSRLPRIQGLRSFDVLPVEETRPLLSYEEWQEYSVRHRLVLSWDGARIVEHFSR